MLQWHTHPSRSPTSAAPDWPERFATRAGTALHPALQAFYAGGTVTADTPLARVPFAALDLETTGLNPARHGIVSIGLVPFGLDRIHCRQARYWLVRPRQELASESVTIHGITHQEIRDAPDIEEIIDDLLAAMTGQVMVVHYRAIERRFLDRAFRLCLNEGLEFPVVDTLELEARVHKRRRTRFLAYLLGRRPASLRLAESRDRYHLPRYGAHHALTDALATAELLQAQISYRYGPETPIRELWR